MNEKRCQEQPNKNHLIHRTMSYYIETKIHDNSFENAIENTIDWYLNNKNWWERIISGEYQNYYQTQYGNR